MTLSVQAADVRQAHDRIRPFIHRTPLLSSRTLDKQTGVSLFLKAEPMQRTGSFKLRGATNFVQSLPEAERARGVVAYSSGNHAQGVAYAAREANIPATIIMPTDAPAAKREATAGYGATVVLYDRYRESREEIGQRIAQEAGAALLPPFDHPWVIAGQGTTALEMLEEQPDLDALVVCLGGGGLLSGCALAAKAHNPNIRLFGVEPEAGNDFQLSLQRNERVRIDLPRTIADGLQTLQPGVHTFPIVKELVESIVLVTDDELRAAMRLLLTRLKLVVEPSGAAALAAVLSGKLPRDLRRIGITLSGGNVDLELLKTL